MESTKQAASRPRPPLPRPASSSPLASFQDPNQAKNSIWEGGGRETEREREREWEGVRERGGGGRERWRKL